MVIKIFKISTMEMWILTNKSGLIDFIEMEMNMLLPKTLTILFFGQCCLLYYLWF